MLPGLWWTLGKCRSVGDIYQNPYARTPACEQPFAPGLSCRRLKFYFSLNWAQIEDLRESYKYLIYKGNSEKCPQYK